MYLDYQIGCRIASVDAEFCEIALLPGWRISRGYVRHITGPFLHRLLLQAPQDAIVDHIDGDPLNNTLSNLRLCSHPENMRNRKLHANSKSGVKGVYPYNGKWRAQIRVGGKKHSLGTFRDIEDAKRAYQRASKDLHGAFSRIS